MSEFVLNDIKSMKVDVLNDSSFQEGQVDIRVTIETGLYIIEAYDTCEKEKALDYAYSNLRSILSRPQINETCRLMRYIFNRAINNAVDGMFYYPYWQFVDDRWTKKEVKAFEKDFNTYCLEEMIEYDFNNQSEVIICYGDFIKHFVQLEVIADLPF